MYIFNCPSVRPSDFSVTMPIYEKSNRQRIEQTYKSLLCILLLVYECNKLWLIFILKMLP